MNKEEAIEVFKSCVDPELSVDIWTLGLIYDFQIENDLVKVLMTFTSPMCPFGPQIVDDIKTKLESKGVKPRITITFDPPWEPTDEVREMLGV